MNFLLGRFHRRYVLNRRCKVLSGHVSKLIPLHCRILDVGAGSGDFALALKGLRPDLKICGIDNVVRKHAKIAIDYFDGIRINAEDNQFDYSLLIDVLHHVGQPEQLLFEAARVAREGVIIKDHINNTIFDKIILSMMDIVGNKPYGVDVIYRYLSTKEWDQLFFKTSLTMVSLNCDLKIYPFPFTHIFDRKMQMLCLLRKKGP